MHSTEAFGLGTKRQPRNSTPSDSHKLGSTPQEHCTGKKNTSTHDMFTPKHQVHSATIPFHLSHQNYMVF